MWEPDPVPNTTATDVERPVQVSARPPSWRGRWHEFVARHGWRAYALPVLVVITVLALFTTKSPAVREAIPGVGHPQMVESMPPVAPSNGQLKSDDPGSAAMSEALESDALPPGGKYAKTGLGTYSTIPGTSGVIGTGANLYRFSIEIENGIGDVDLNGFASTVMSTLSDSHSWPAGKDVSLQRVESGPVDFHVTLVSAMTVRQLCGYDIPVETSCYAPDHDNRVVLNDARWVRGDVAYIADLANYHRYMINHEVGHALGHGHEFACLKGGMAPVMMQQTITLKAHNGKLCTPNPWPFP